MAIPKRKIGNSRFKKLTPLLHKAWEIEIGRSASGISLMAIFKVLRRGKKGTTTDMQQDLLRAYLVFTCSGLDAIIKQVINDCLPTILERGGSPYEKFIEYASLNLNKDLETNDKKRLLRLLLSDTPKEIGFLKYVEYLTRNSLQSYEEIIKVYDIMGISKKRIIRDKAKIGEAFRVRNKIIHEMDMDINGHKKRNQRSLKEMEQHIKLIEDIIIDIILNTDELLKDT